MTEKKKATRAVALANNSRAAVAAPVPDAMTEEQVALIKDTIAKGASDDELRLFLYTAKRTGLDPLMRQIHFVKRKAKNPDGTWRDQMTIQTGIDGYRAIAVRTGHLAGIDDAVFDTEKAIHPEKATVTVYRMVGGQRCPFAATARWDEYVQMKDEYIGGQKTGNKTTSGLWAKMPYLMLAKCAEALALRKAFPNDLSGIYTTEEMAQADNDGPITAVAEVVDQTIDKMKAGVQAAGANGRAIDAPPRPKTESIEAETVDAHAAPPFDDVNPMRRLRDALTKYGMPEAVLEKQVGKPLEELSDETIVKMTKRLEEKIALGDTFKDSAIPLHDKPPSPPPARKQVASAWLDRAKACKAAAEGAALIKEMTEAGESELKVRTITSFLEKQFTGPSV